jgi:hypothetical protein
MVGGKPGRIGQLPPALPDCGERVIDDVLGKGLLAEHQHCPANLCTVLDLEETRELRLRCDGIGVQSWIR